MAPRAEAAQFIDPELARTECPLSDVRSGAVVGSNTISAAGFRARTSGRFTSSDLLTAEFSNATVVHDLRIDPGATETPHGYAVEYLLSGWRRIDYVAIGFLQDGSFHHVKRRHVEQDSMLTSTVFSTSLLLRAQGAEWAMTEDPYQFRIYVKGEASEQGASCALQSLSILHAEPGSDRLMDDGLTFQESLASVGRFRDRPEMAAQIASDADHYAKTGEIAIIPGQRMPWPHSAEAPVGLSDNATLRFSWHALHPAARLATTEGEHAPELTRAATEIAAAWIQGNIHHASRDHRYAWYDHGAAERLVSLIIILDAATHQAPRSIRSERVLNWQIIEHARLLACPEFYAANQVTIYHNHAWFQDIALLVAATVFSGPEAERWREIALGRLAKQFDELIVDEGDLAVFSENSIAYHHGITAIMELVAGLDAGDGVKTAASSLVEPLKRWGSFLRYDHGPAPSQGDSYRLDPRVTKGSPTHRGRAAKVLPQAGYAVVHGEDGSDRYSLFLFNTGANATHKHQDNCSITLGFAGVEWLVDPSFYSHDYGSSIPRYLRGRWAHNALNVSELDYSIEPGLTTLTGVAAEQFEFSATHRAYDGLEVGRVVRGDLRGLDIELEDRVDGPLRDGDEAILTFHFGEDVTVHPTGDPDRVVLRHPASNRSVELTLPSDHWEVVRGRGDSERNTSVIGHGFQEAVDSESLLITLPAGAGNRYLSRIRAT